MRVRTHIVLPEDLVKEIDKIAGHRKRSEFIEEAVRTKLRLLRQQEAIKALKEAGPIILPGDFLGLEDFENSSDYIHEMRRRDTEHRMKKVEQAGDDDAMSAR